MEAREYLTLGCVACGRDVTIGIPPMRSENPKDHVCMWIVMHYRNDHTAILDKFMHDYTRFLFAKIGMPLPV